MQLTQAIHAHTHESAPQDSEALNTRTALGAVTIVFALTTLFSLYGLGLSKAYMPTLHGPYPAVHVDAEGAGHLLR